ncbi:arylsulfatase [Marinoscillum furvescens]|uniref:Arylsulfatase A-like enzyme n=1 Tax=Marinoscillum furvescens DSM 4134 TaxID=1122208 RepID=A0A3D9L7B5_MARFU|nr:arylsulfatase [Marinoscillum furvescens]REE01549.1 arylsulfatase A-like enzyme [Marinoscillum furvescens DSM 4134]
MKSSQYRWKVYQRSLAYILLMQVCGLLISCTSSEQQVRQPNVLVILTDDQGAGDFGFMGNEWLETPVLDRLVREGVHLTNFYVSPVCAPTRASFLTGRYHQRTGVTGVTRGRENMSLDEQTIAQAFKANDYATGCFGKWHNGAHYPYHPMGRGFDQFVGFASGHYTNYFDSKIERNGRVVDFEGYLSNVITDAAIDFIGEAVAADKPFFCYVPYNTPHTPAQVPDRYFDKYKAKGLDDFNAAMYGMCENIDENIGKLLASLATKGIENETLVVFFSDNGPVNYRYNAGLKGKKASVDEGGVKVPCLFYWPGKLPAGHTVEALSAHIDLLPTIQSLTGISYAFDKALDGKDLSARLKGKADGEVHDALYEAWWDRRRVRTPDYLLVNNELYDIRQDPGQQNDISKDSVQLMAKLEGMHTQWKASLNLAADQKINPIPVGYDAYPVNILPAHEAELYPPFPQREDRKHTGIAYYAQYGWAHDWIDHWTQTEAFFSWPVEVMDSATYHVYFKYNLAKENTGCKLRLSAGAAALETVVTKAFHVDPLPSPDRAPRGEEAPERHWAVHYAGTITLPAGPVSLKMETLEITGTESIELKEIVLSKKTALDETYF